MDAARTRLCSWGDPAALARAGEGRSGINFLRSIVDGTLPTAPLLESMGIRFTEVEVGRTVFECEIGEHHYNLIGTVHGGFAATMLDTATGCAVYSTLGVGDRWTTLNLHTDYIRPLSTGSGIVRCVATVVTTGRTIGLADAELTEPDGRLVARGRASCMIFRAER